MLIMLMCCVRARHDNGKPAALVWPHTLKGQIRKIKTTERYCAVSLFYFCPLVVSGVQGTSWFLREMSFRETL